MPTTDTHIDIDAPPDRVWQVLTNFADYPNWNPFIIKVQGEPIAGTKIKKRIVLPNA